MRIFKHFSDLQYTRQECYSYYYFPKEEKRTPDLYTWFIGLTDPSSSFSSSSFLPPSRWPKKGLYNVLLQCVSELVVHK